MKCLCKNGQNGDPSWKKSCSWSFNDAPWSASDVKRVQCKPTTQSTTVANPNRHRFCKILDGWTSECSQCYSYTYVDDIFFNPEDVSFYSDDYTCEFTISTVCDPNFVDKLGRGCDKYAEFGWCENKLQIRSYLSRGVLTDKGFMTGFNCPQCGCGENGPIHFHDTGYL